MLPQRVARSLRPGQTAPARPLYTSVPRRHLGVAASRVSVHMPLDMSSSIGVGRVGIASFFGCCGGGIIAGGNGSGSGSGTGGTGYGVYGSRGAA
jgi:hypothetical protein